MSIRVRRRGALALSTTLDTPAAVADPFERLADGEVGLRLRSARLRRPDWSIVRTDVSAAFPPWLAARVIVLTALALANFVVNNLHVSDRAVSAQLHNGLFAWDGGFYRGIAEHGYGYGFIRHEALRFFPLFPLAGRALGIPLGHHMDWALLILANGSALALGALIHRLVIIESGDQAMARRAAWLIALVPPAFVLVLAYSEAMFMALAVAMFLALRTRRWGWAMLAGLLAGLTRPLGVLLVVPAAIEAARSLALARHQDAFSWRPGRRGQTVRTVGSRAAVVLAPVAGAGIFCAWVWGRYGDLLLPLHLQQDIRRRGRVVDPFTALFHEGRGILHGQHVGSGLHVFWAIGLAALVVVCFRRWPACYGAFAAMMLLAALSSRNLDSLERYALSAFPFALAGAALTASARVERVVLVLGATALEGYAALSFLNAVVP